MILIPKIFICCLLGLFVAYVIGRMIGLGISVSLRNAQHKQHGKFASLNFGEDSNTNKPISL